MSRAVVAAVIPALLLVGWATTGSVGAQAPGCLPTSDRTIGPHGFPGLGVKRVAPVYTDALQLALSEGFRNGEAQGEATELNSEGFVSGTSQLYFGRKRKTRDDEGLAITTQLGSPEQAQAELNRIVAHVLRFGPWKRFTVPAIAGSRGFRARSKSEGASNLYFADGDYFYGVGRFVSHSGTGSGQVTTAGINLYNRVHGAPACP
jgi:hypothetical protein